MSQLGVVRSDCRACGSTNLAPVVDLGVMALTGVFPQDASVNVPSSPLEVVVCLDCGLAQLLMDFPASELFGSEYGYRSSLNASMLSHLNSKAELLARYAHLEENDVVVDIGANDGSFIENEVFGSMKRIAIDPAISSLRDRYSRQTCAVPKMFSPALFWEESGVRAKLVTSIAMFYDLPDPISFAKDVKSILAPDGVWHLEQSYAPSMLRSSAYDTICHEHTEYYQISSLERIFEQAGLKAVDASLNAVNGGSIALSVVHSENPRSQSNSLTWLRSQEVQESAKIVDEWRAFGRRTQRHREHMLELFAFVEQVGATVSGVGASTKGNVLLQYCGLSQSNVQEIGEVNPDKFGRVTPGSHIPIVDEREFEVSRPDFLLVLPWHFRPQMETRFRSLLSGGLRLIFPLPTIEIVG